ncbi:MAG: chemotaxis protein CheW [Syntrophobacteria bacterium]
MADAPTGPGRKILEQLPRHLESQLPQETAGPDQQQYLSFRLNNEWYALGVQYLGEVLAPPKITKVPSVPPHIVGVMNLRGEILSVIDLKRLFGLTQGGATQEQAIVVVEHGQIRTGFLVDAIGDLVSFAPEEFNKEPAVVREGQRDVFEGTAPWGESVVSIVDLDWLLKSEGISP